MLLGLRSEDDILVLDDEYVSPDPHFATRNSLTNPRFPQAASPTP